MKTHIFIDADNVNPRKAISYYQRSLQDEGDNIIGCECFGVVFSKEYKQLEGDEKFRIYPCSAGKNSADLWLTAIAVDILSYENPEKIVIISSDRDFLPLAYLAQQKGISTAIGADPSKVKGIRSEVKKMNLLTDVFLLDELPVKKKNITLSTIVGKDDILITYFNRCQNKIDSIKFLFDDKQVDLPFVNGMPKCYFAHMVKKIFDIPKKKKLKKIAYTSNSLYVKEDHVFQN